MSTFTFSIISPRGKAFEGTAESVRAAGAAGGFGLLAGHTPMIANVQPGLTAVKTDGRTDFFYTGEGVMEVSREESLLLVDEAEKVESEEAARQRAQQRRERQAASRSSR